MLKYELEQMSEKTWPKEFTFGDTFSVIRERHRRRPVTSNRLPPGWKLTDLANWMELDLKGQKAHRAVPDAMITWWVLEETLKRYGTEYLTPKQQLGEFFFKSSQDTMTEDGSIS